MSARKNDFDIPYGLRNIEVVFLNQDCHELFVLVPYQNTIEGGNRRSSHGGQRLTS